MISHTLAELASSRRVVVKVGSALLVEQGQPRAQWLASLARDIAGLRESGAQVVVVSSGAIALGAARLGLPGGGRGSLADAQAAASVGQIVLSGIWADLLEAQSLAAAQMLVTLDDLEDRRRYLNIAATLDLWRREGPEPAGAGTRAAIEARKIGDLGKAIDFAMSPNLGNAYPADTKAAEALLLIGESKRDATLPAAEHAALTATCLALYNLDAAILFSDILTVWRASGSGMESVHTRVWPKSR